MKYTQNPKSGVNVVGFFATAEDADKALFAVDFALQKVPPGYEVVEAETELLPSSDTGGRVLYQIRFDIAGRGLDGQGDCRTWRK